MQMPDDDWRVWMKDFSRSDTGEIDLDPAHLASRARAETRKQWLGLLGELGMGALAFGIYGALIVRGTSAAVLAIAAGSFAFSVVYLARLYQARRGTWRSLGKDTRAALALTLARRRADVTWYGFLRVAIVAFGVAAAAWTPFMLSTYRDIYAAEPWRAVVGFGGASLTLGILYVRAQRRLDRAREEQRALQTAYHDLVEPC